MNAFLIAVALISAIFFYFLPGIIASNRNHRNKSAIIVLDLFLGWTFIGWVVALVWAFTSNVDPVRASKAPSAADSWDRG